jgi:hypothetical protein
MEKNIVRGLKERSHNAILDKRDGRRRQRDLYCKHIDGQEKT